MTYKKSPRHADRDFVIVVKGGHIITIPTPIRLKLLQRHEEFINHLVPTAPISACGGTWMVNLQCRDFLSIDFVCFIVNCITIVKSQFVNISA